MTDNTILSRREGLMAADMNGSAVMMDIMTGKYYNLGQVGGRIWELLEEPMTVAALIKKLGFPEKMSTNAFLQAVNLLYSLDELKQTLEKHNG